MPLAPEDLAMRFDLDPEEEALLDRLRAPPIQGTLRISNIWIVEWLPSIDRKTGTELADWANQSRPGWAALYCCQSKNEVIEAISAAEYHARSANSSPVLHIEAHGDEHGIYGPDENGRKDQILWDELTEPLQHLNEATGCNLVVVIAACLGNAGVQAFRRGPRAPGIVLIGPVDTILPKNLFDATKELYRIIASGDAKLEDIIGGMSSESGDIPFVEHRFTEIVYNVLASQLIAAARPKEKEKRRSFAINQLMKRGATKEQAENAIDHNRDVLSEVPSFQRVWNEMFCIDLCPENQDRFGLDMAAIYHAAEELEANR